VDIYVDAAREAGLAITHVIETHLHNDYVSGGRELAALTGATHVIGAGADLGYAHRPVVDGEAFSLGAIRFTTLDTPGHTPEHVSYAVADTDRAAEPFLFFAADKTDPGAFNLPLYLAFADPMNTPGLLLAPKMARGFRFVIMDVMRTDADHVIELNAPEELYDIAAHAAGDLIRAQARPLKMPGLARTFDALARQALERRIGALEAQVRALTHPLSGEDARADTGGRRRAPA